LGKWVGLTTNTLTVSDVPFAAYNATVQMTLVRGVAALLGVRNQLVDVVSVSRDPGGGARVGIQVLSATRASAQRVARAMEATLPDSVTLFFLRSAVQN
jgi:ribosome-interacting GTPase 1